MKSQMLLRRTLHKTKVFFQKTLKNLKTLLFGGYQKLPKTPFVNPFFSASNSIRKFQELDDLYREFSEPWGTLNISAVSPGVLMVENGECGQNHMNTTEQIIADSAEIMRRKEEKMEDKKNEGKREEVCGGRSQNLAQKMKELEMFELDDVDHQLDIEEVLHYYSRLKCPVYIDIIDKFFMDMYSEFVLPQLSVSVNSSMRRLGPVKL